MAESIIASLSLMSPDHETRRIRSATLRQWEYRIRQLRSPLDRDHSRPIRWLEFCEMMTAVVLTGTILFGQLQSRAMAIEPPTSSAIPVKVEDAAPQTTVTVVDQAGRSIRHGTVQLSGDTRTGACFDQTISIRDGIAVVPLKSIEVEQMRFAIKSSGYLTHHRKYSREKAERYLKVADQYTFKLKSGVSIGGQVVSQNGTPVVNADVHAMCPSVGIIENGIDAFEQHVSTDENGKWEMSGAPAGLEHLTLRITQEAELGGDAPIPLIAVSPRDRDQLTSFTDVRTLNVPLTTTATVRDPEGKPVTGALVLFAGRDFYRDHGANQIQRRTPTVYSSCPTPAVAASQSPSFPQTGRYTR